MQKSKTKEKNHSNKEKNCTQFQIYIKIHLANIGSAQLPTIRRLGNLG